MVSAWRRSQEEMGDQPGVHDAVWRSLPVLVGCRDSVRLQYGVWASVVRVPGKTHMEALSAAFTTGQATVLAAAAGMSGLTFPMATPEFFQFVFAAITVIILLVGTGRMSFRGMGAFLSIVDDLGLVHRGSIQPVGGGWLGCSPVPPTFRADMSSILPRGPARMQRWCSITPAAGDREHLPPEVGSLDASSLGAGILWLGCRTAFNGVAIRTSLQRQCGRGGAQHQYCYGLWPCWCGR